MTRIALDAMGGDHAPGPNIDGAVDALHADPTLEVVLVGDVPALRTLFDERPDEDRGPGGDFGGRLSFHQSDGVVGMHEKPVEAMRSKPNSSIAVCWKLMAGREVDGIVSAGNTGAVVAGGLRTRLFLRGVKRPGIAVGLPTAKGRSVLLDVGANPAARPEHLLQYGLMGRIYAKALLGVEQPRVGLMNIGSEEGKGNDLYRETHQLLRDSAMAEHYVGNVEGRGLYQGEADVLVCEGFVGNVVLKVSEGIAEFLMKAAARQVLGDLDAERDVAKASFGKLEERFRYRGTGGAPLLGIDGICIICHGSSDGVSIRNALKVACTFEHEHVNDQISAALAG